MLDMLLCKWYCLAHEEEVMGLFPLRVKDLAPEQQHYYKEQKIIKK